MATEAHKRAAQRLAEMPVVDSLPYVRKRDSVSWEGSKPDLLRFYHSFIRDLQCRGYPMWAHCFVRSGAEQDRLYHEGFSKARAGQSAHNHGSAVDIVHFTRFWELDRHEWAVIGAIGKETARRCNLKVTWGGDWSFYDPAHWELSDWNGVKKPAALDNLSFSDAFAAARRQGLLSFRWNGKEYAVKLA